MKRLLSALAATLLFSCAAGNLLAGAGAPLPEPWKKTDKVVQNILKEDPTYFKRQEERARVGLDMREDEGEKNPTLEELQAMPTKPSVPREECSFKLNTSPSQASKLPQSWAQMARSILIGDTVGGVVWRAPAYALALCGVIRSKKLGSDVKKLLRWAKKKKKGLIISAVSIAFLAGLYALLYIDGSQPQPYTGKLGGYAHIGGHVVSYFWNKPLWGQAAK